MLSLGFMNREDFICDKAEVPSLSSKYNVTKSYCDGVHSDATDTPSLITDPRSPNNRRKFRITLFFLGGLALL